MPHAGTINYCHSFALNGTCSKGNKVKFSENSFKLIKIQCKFPHLTVAEVQQRYKSKSQNKRKKRKMKENNNSNNNIKEENNNNSDDLSNEMGDDDGSSEAETSTNTDGKF